MALKLYKENGQSDNLAYFKYVDNGSPPTGYTETDILLDWDLSFQAMVENEVLSMNAFRVKVKASYDAIGTPVTADKEIASKWFVVDKTTRDSVKSAAEQEEDADLIYETLLVKTNKKEFSDHASVDTVSNVTDAIESVVKTISNSISSYLNVSGVIILDCSFHPNVSHHVTVNGNATIDIDHIPDNIIIYLMLEQDGTGGYTITLPTFDNLDTQPTVTTTASKMDTLIIMKMNGLIHLHSYIKPGTTF